MLPEVHLDFIKGLFDLRVSLLEKDKQNGELAWGPPSVPELATEDPFCDKVALNFTLTFMARITLSSCDIPICH